MPNTVTAYVANQLALAASPAGRLAVAMTPGTRWIRPDGVTVTVWMGWEPDTSGDQEVVAAERRWAPPSPDHNAEIGVTVRGQGAERVRVASVGDWLPAVS